MERIYFCNCKLCKYENKNNNYLNIPKVLLWIESITNIINIRIN